VNLTGHTIPTSGFERQNLRNPTSDNLNHPLYSFLKTRPSSLQSSLSLSQQRQENKHGGREVTHLSIKRKERKNQK